MTRTYFDKELESLHIDLIKMGSMIEDAIFGSIEGLTTGNRDLCLSVVNGDKAIDEMEKQIETKCLRILWHDQPLAKDLRAVSTAIKMITDMERIGDQAQDIADIALSLHAGSINEMSTSIPKMAQEAAKMVKNSISSFVDGDLELAKSTIDHDDVVDGMFDVIKQELINLVKQDSGYADGVIDALMIIKYLERIADHAVNICEWVEFYQTGIHKQNKII